MTANHLTIGMFTDSYLPEINGVVTSIAATAKALRRRGHRVIVVAPASEDEIDDGPDVFRFHSTPFPFYPQFRMAFPLPAKVLAALPRLPFDIVHVHSLFFVGCLGAYLAQHRRVPLVFTYHTRWTEYAHYLPFDPRVTSAQAVWLSREFCNRCDCVVTPTESVSQLLRSYGIDTRIEVIPTGVDLGLFGDPDECGRASLFARQHAPTALFVGRLGKEKNLDLLLDAFAVVYERLPQARLIIVGSGPYEQHLRKRALERPCGSRIEFTGPLAQTELGSYYRCADFLVFPSTSETQGLVMHEAMAHGRPVVAVDCPISREVVPPEAGRLVPADPQTFATAMLELLTLAADDRARASSAARSAVAPLEIDRVTERLLELYASVSSHLAAAT